MEGRVIPWLIFDGDCAFCTSSATWVAARLHSSGRADARLVAWQFVDLAELGTTPDRAQREVLWLTADGRIFGGAAAFARWLRFRGGPYAALGVVLDVPPFSWLAAGVYRLVARNRHRLPGGTPACALPPRGGTPAEDGPPRDGTSAER